MLLVAVLVGTEELDRRDKEIHSVDASGGAVWELTDPHGPLRDIQESLGALFDDPVNEGLDCDIASMVGLDGVTRMHQSARVIHQHWPRPERNAEMMQLVTDFTCSLSSQVGMGVEVVYKNLPWSLVRVGIPACPIAE